MNKVEKCGETLKDPMLLTNIIKEVQKEGVVGEEDAIMCLIMKIMLRYVKDADKTSSNLVISDKSGGGKDYLVKSVCDVILPKKDYFHRTSLSEKVFTYWNADEKDFTWNGKVIHLEDPDDNLIQCQGFRVMASGESTVTVVKDQKAINLKVEGKPVILVTSLNADIDTEGIRRWDTIRMDTGIELTKAVIKNRILTKAGLIKNNKNKELKEALHSLLVPLDVNIPFIKKIITIFPTMLAMRTISGKFIDYIKASALLHQMQRKRNSDGSIDATWADYEYARFVFTKLIGMYGVPLNRTEETLLDILINAGSCKEMALSIKEISTMFDHSMSWLYENLKNKDKFKTTGLIKEMLEFDERSNKEITKYYTDISIRKIDLPPCWFFFDQEKDESGSPRFFDPISGAFSRGFLVFVVFEDYAREIQVMREKAGLEPQKDYNSYIYKKTNKTGSRKPSQQEESGFPKKLESGKKPAQNQELPLFDKITSLSTYIRENKSAGYVITHDMLLKRFDEEFINICVNNGTLYKIKEGYEMRYG